MHASLKAHLVWFVEISCCVCVFFYVTFLSTHAPHRVLYIDMEGRSDDQSIKFMIERMAPRRVAFVHGSLAAAAKLKEAIDTQLMPALEQLFAPKEDPKHRDRDKDQDKGRERDGDTAPSRKPVYRSPGRRSRHVYAPC